LEGIGCSPQEISTRRPDPCSYQHNIGCLGSRSARRLRLDMETASSFPRGERHHCQVG
ncbi:hypothetical protein CORC01_01029, partial [Colletotrichum orchidophilum]